MSSGGWIRCSGAALTLLAAACGRPAGELSLYPGNADALMGQGVAGAPATEAMPGYIFIAPVKSRFSYLLDAKGKELHRWESQYFPGTNTELLEDGSILRCARVLNSPGLTSGGQGGRLQKIAWSGELLWDFEFATEQYLQHHDATLLPSGNVLLLAWERKPAAEASARGRDPSLLPGELFWPDWIAEVRPLPPTGGEIVWEWHAWDHIIQDFDRGKALYGQVATHPELIDMNGDRFWRSRSAEEQSAEAQHLVELGYAAAAPTPQSGGGAGGAQAGSFAAEPDWMHANSIAYHPGLDLIVISVRRFNEAWVIDHSTTTAEAASHAGGRHGRGGDLLYRWGNPSAYSAGGREDQQLFFQHHVSWIPQGLPGAGNFLCFNNGEDRPDGTYSSIEEWRMPIQPDGRIELGPERPLWRYTASPKEQLYSSFLAGAQRLPNGSTLITEGETGRLVEVASDGRLLWQWQSTYGGEEAQTAQSGRSARAPKKALFRAYKIPLDHRVSDLLR